MIGSLGVIRGEGDSQKGLGSKTIWGRAPNFKYQLANPPKLFSETMPSGAYFFMISSWGLIMYTKFRYQRLFVP